MFKYAMVIAGWLGIALGFGTVFWVVPQEITMIVLVFASGLLALEGHHQLAYSAS